MAKTDNVLVAVDIHGNVLEVGDLVACDTVGHQNLAVGVIDKFGAKKVRVSQIHADGRSYNTIHNKYPTQCILIKRAKDVTTEKTFTKGEVEEWRDDAIFACATIAARYAGKDSDMVKDMLRLMHKPRSEV